ncbi:hypothetical protein CGRA01v4_07847 [Colletotrichum graminicola]|nr:hypothetical protein CGRA01v4_07847 [Colletotrichum graminicola]
MRGPFLKHEWGEQLNVLHSKSGR